MTEPEELVLDKARVAGVGLVVAALAAGYGIWSRSRQKAEAIAAAERRAKWEAEWEAAAPERERRRLEAEDRERQRHEEFLAACEAKGWRYKIIGECHLERHKKQFPTELDALMCTWLQHQKHGDALQRAYRCDGSDNPDGSGCRSWHLTSKSSLT